MSEKRYVQHISGQGEKWEVCGESCQRPDCWYVEKHNLALPKSEYRLYEPPERWVDVTQEMSQSSLSHLKSWDHKDTPVVIHIHDSNYRLRKVQLFEHREKLGCTPCIDWNEKWAFIVEKRES